MKFVTALAVFSALSLTACDAATSTALAALSRVSAAAQREMTHSNVTFDIADVFFDNCNGEMVAYEGRYHLVTKVEYDAGDVTVKTINNVENFSGVGLTSGAKYQLHQNYKDDFSVIFTPDANIVETIEYRFRVSRQGSDDNLWFRQTYRFTFPPGNIEFINNELECRG